MIKTPFANGLRCACLCAGLLLSYQATADVNISGLNQAQEDNVRAWLRLDDEACNTARWRVAQLYSAAPKEIEHALAALGYYSVSVESNLTHADKCWSADFAITPGQPVVLRDVVIKLTGAGAVDPDLTRLLTTTPLKTGNVLNHGAWEKLKSGLADHANQHGYFDARFDVSRVDAYPGTANADLELRFETGERYRFGEFSYRQDALKPDLINRYTDVAPGDPFDSQSLFRLQKALLESGYFVAAYARPLKESASNHAVPVEVELEPAKAQRYTVGAGFSTNTGPRVRGNFENRRVNTSGHLLEALLELSPLLSKTQLSYYVPRGDPRVERYGAELGYQTEDTDTSSSDTLKLRMSNTLKRRHGWKENYFVDIAFEDFDIGSQRQTTRLIVPGVSRTRSQISEERRPREGQRLELGLSGSAGFLGSQAEFVQLTAGAGRILPIADAGRLLLRVNLGATATDDFNDLPPSLRFFAGGDRSVRGYDLEELGPRDSDGEVIGGRYLMIASAEYDHRIRRQWSLAAFVDAGNAFDDFSESISLGIGVGVRWYSVLGPIRLDVAKGLDDPERSVRVHISLGPDL